VFATIFLPHICPVATPRGVRPFSLPLFTNVLEAEFSEVCDTKERQR
jgi:hypothetical protein